MNWLFYIGGILPFLVLGMVVCNSFVGSNGLLKEIGNYFRGGWLLSLLLIWIWFCWKFVK